MDKKSPEQLNSVAVSKKFNPADYFTFVLDQEIRNAGMPGGCCGYVVELDAQPDLSLLQQRLDQLAEHFPQITAQLEQRGKHFFWVATPRRLELTLEQCPPDQDASTFCQQQVLAILNQPAPLNTALPFSLHWLGHAEGGALLLCWLHPLLDARGVQILVNFLSGALTDLPQETPALVLQKLSNWPLWKKIWLMIKAKRHNTRTNSLDSSLPTTLLEGPQNLRLQVRRYSMEQTATISRLATQHSGLAGKSLYTIGCFMRAMEQVGPPSAKAGYCIPYAFNLRKQNAITPVFGNHVGCLFAQATREQVRDRKGLFQHLLAQYRQTVREELDFAYLPLMWLGQYLSPSRYATLLRKQRSGGELSSCWFSDIGEIRFDHAGFMGAKITGVFHLTWSTLPPGLALLTGQLNGQLTLSYNYLYPAIDEHWLEQVIAVMDTELLGETTATTQT